MKTDKEKLTELLQEWGVEVREKTGMSDDSEDGTQIKVGGYREYDKVAGYRGSYTLFEFDEQGKFIQIGAWE